MGGLELSWYHRHSRWISSLPRLHLQRRPHPLPAVSLSSLLSACQGNRCAPRTRKLVTPSSSEPAANIHMHKDGWDNGTLSNANQLKLTTSFSSVAQLTCYKNPPCSFRGCSGTCCRCSCLPRQNNLFCQADWGIQIVLSAASLKAGRTHRRHHLLFCFALIHCIYWHSCIMDVMWDGCPGGRNGGVGGVHLGEPQSNCERGEF